MRLCTGLRPSRTSGSARCMMTLIAYSRNERSISSSSSTGSTRPPTRSIISRFSFPGTPLGALLYVQEPDVGGVLLDEAAPRLDVAPHQRVEYQVSLIHISEPTRLGMISYAV